MLQAVTIIESGVDTHLARAKELLSKGSESYRVTATLSRRSPPSRFRAPKFIGGGLPDASFQKAIENRMTSRSSPCTFSRFFTMVGSTRSSAKNHSSSGLSRRTAEQIEDQRLLLRVEGDDAEGRALPLRHFQPALHTFHRLGDDSFRLEAVGSALAPIVDAVRNLAEADSPVLDCR